MTRLFSLLGVLGLLLLATACGSAHVAANQQGLRVFDPTGKVRTEIALPSILRRGIGVGSVMGQFGESQLYLPLTAAGMAKCHRFAKAIAVDLGGHVYRPDSWGCDSSRPAIVFVVRVTPERLGRALSAATGVRVPVGAQRAFFLPGQPKQFIGCVMTVDMPAQSDGVECFAYPGVIPYKPGNFTLVKMGLSGRLKVCHGACVGNPEGFATLGYGHTLTLKPFRCSAHKVEVRCVVITTGHGFVLGIPRLKRLN